MVVDASHPIPTECNLYTACMSMIQNCILKWRHETTSRPFFHYAASIKAYLVFGVVFGFKKSPR